MYQNLKYTCGAIVFVHNVPVCSVVAADVNNWRQDKNV